MIPYIDFKLFEIAGLPIHMFGVLVAAGVIVGDRITVREQEVVHRRHDRRRHLGAWDLAQSRHVAPRRRDRRERAARS